MIIGIIGLGFVGGAMHKSFLLKGMHINTNLYEYDKFKNGGIGNFNNMLKCDILFLALPTLYDSNKHKYNIDPIMETCEKLEKYEYNGVIVIKSTIEPETINNLSNKFKLSSISLACLLL